MRPAIDITGRRFGRLVAVTRHGRTPGREILWACRCDCGRDAVVSSYKLRTGDTASCGCLRAERVAAAHRTHGHRAGGTSREYATWRSMWERCALPTQESFKHYGGRGITVCERWRSFENFLADMGPKPRGLSIDRVDVDGNYEPGNCRWATAMEQRHNRRDSRKGN